MRLYGFLHIPYTIELIDTLYIQNENITNNIDKIAFNTYIGENVTSLKPQGNVRIINGKTILRNLDKIFIKNSFKVERGASFEIKTNK